MKMILTYIMMISMMIQSTSVDKEHYKNDFRRIQSAYKSYPNLSFNVSYSDKHNSIVDTSVAAKYCFKGSKFYYKMAKVEVIKNNEYIISINHQKKDIVIYPSAGFTNDYLPIAMVDSFFGKNQTSIEYTESNHGRTGQYVINFSGKNKSFNKMELEFDKTNYLMQKMRLYVSPENVPAAYDETVAKGQQSANVDYVFSNYKFNNIDDKLFSTGTYISGSGDKFKPSPQYPGYHVVSLIPHQQSK